MAIEALRDIQRNAVSAFQVGGGGSANVGSATIDFGAFPGSSEASVNVTGQGSILTTSYAFAFIQSNDTTADHTANDHAYAAALIGLVCGSFVAGTGFTIKAICPDRLCGTFKVRFMWI